MRSWGKIKEWADAAGCGDELAAIEDVIEELKTSKTTNVAVLGEANCGKTSLINKLAGMEARKPTQISMDERPLMVTFGSGETKQEYEAVDVKNSMWEENKVVFYEIPIDMALDEDTGNLKPIAEKMDAAIYILSAITPLTASDAANIGAIADQYPVILYLSRAEKLEDKEYHSVVSYAERELTARFGSIDTRITDSLQPGIADVILKRLQEYSVDELRELHIMNMEQKAVNTIAGRLNRQLKQLDEEERERWEEQKKKEDEYRNQLFEWDQFRVAMMERQQEAARLASKTIGSFQCTAKEKLIQEFREKESGKEREWLRHGLKETLQGEMEAAMHHVIEKTKDKTEEDAAWLISEVKQKLGVRMAVDNMSSNLIICMEDGFDEKEEKPDRQKLAMAAGTGVLAGGAIFGGLALIPACIVAIPASLATFYFVKESIREPENHREELEQMVEKCCQKNFGNLEKNVHQTIRQYYDDLVEKIRRFSERENETADFSDIKEKRERILGVLDELAREW